MSSISKNVSVVLSVVFSVLLPLSHLSGEDLTITEPRSVAKGELVKPAMAVHPANHSSCTDVRVHIRTLMGQKRPKVEGDEAHEVVIDPKVSDLREKLTKLDFQSFKLLTERSAVIPVTQRKVIKLAQGHKLALRPLYANSERVGVWIRWKDREGMEILDTRLHFHGSEHIVTGMETEKNRGLILAIQVSPIEIESAS